MAEALNRAMTECSIHPHAGPTRRLALALLPCFRALGRALIGEGSLFEDHGSTRIDLACPRCHQQFKVRLRKLQFGADLSCRLCRHEFSARDVSHRPEIQEALARLGMVVNKRVRHLKSHRSRDIAEERTGAST